MSDKVVPKIVFQDLLEQTGIKGKRSPYLIKKYQVKYQSCFALSKFLNDEISNITLNVGIVDSHL